MNQPDILSLLRDFLNTDNSIRKTAEAQINQLPTLHFQSAVRGLVAAMGNSDAAISESASVIFRKLFLDKEEVLKKFSKEMAEQVCKSIFNLMQNDRLSLLKRSCQILTKLYVYVMRQTELLNLVSTMPSSATKNQKIALMYMVQISCQYAFTVEVLLKAQSQLQAIFMKFFQDPSAEVRAATMPAITKFLLAITQKQLMKFQSVMPTLLKKGIECLQADQESGKKALSSINQLIENHPKFVKSFTSDLISLFTQIMDSKLSDPLRIQALSGLQVLVEAHPGLVRKDQTFKKATCPVYMKMLMQIESISMEQWSEQLKGQGSSSSNVSIAAKQSLVMLNKDLGVKFMLPIFTPFIHQFIKSNNPAQEHAAMTVLGMISQNISQVVPIESIVPVLLSVQRESPILQEDLIVCLALLSQQYAPEMQQKYGYQMTEVIIKGLNNSNPRVRLRAIEMITNYLKGIVDSQDEVTEAPNGISQRVEQVISIVVQNFKLALRNSLVQIQEESLMALSILADLAQSAFKGHYSMLMSDLPKLVMSEEVPQSVKEKSLICMGHVLSSLQGEQQFQVDCPRIMGQIINLQRSITEVDNSLHSAIFEFYIKLSQILRDNFSDYLSAIIDPLLQALALDINIHITDSAEHLDKDKFSSLAMDFRLFGGMKNIVLNTAALQLKTKGTVLLLSLAQNCGSGFYPYIERVWPLIKSNFSFKYKKEIRLNMYRMFTALAKICPPQQRVALQQQFLPVALLELQAKIQSKDDKAVSTLMQQVVLNVDCISVQIKSLFLAASAMVQSIKRETEQYQEQQMQSEQLQQVYEWCVKGAEKWKTEQLRKGIPEDWLKDYQAQTAEAD